MKQPQRIFLSRRKFLAASAAVGAGAAIFPTTLRAQGANDDLRVAVVGFNGRGENHIKSLKNMKGVRLVALCDADQNVIDRELKKCDDEKNPYSPKPKAYQDVRNMLESKDIDAVVTATPNHWHTLITVWSCQAGKDVFVEKPISHNIWEGARCEMAANKYNRIVMAGTQRRSDLGFHQAVKFLQGGGLGKILYARGLCYKKRDSIGKVTSPTPISASVDYDLWCGPAAREPLMRKKLHYDWHWVWPTGNGDIGNQGIHEMDQCRWALGQPDLPPRVFAFGGRFKYDDDATTPNTQVAVFDYQPAPLIFEVRGLPRSDKDEKPIMDNYKGVRIGIVVQCENGYYAAGENGGWVYDNNDQKVKQFTQEGQGSHIGNFIKAVRSRKQSDITAPARECHISSALCHMGNVSYRLGTQMKAEEVAERVKSDKLGSESLGRVREHLAANGVDLTKELPTLGPTLQMDPKSERFTGELSDKANVLLKDPYRKGFEVPEQV